MTACEREDRRFEPPSPGARVKAEQRASMIASLRAQCVRRGDGQAPVDLVQLQRLPRLRRRRVGPALTDDVWIYGGDALSIYTTIAEGRPNGMPGYAGRVPEDQLWQLTAYVRSLAGLRTRDSAPNRDDALLTRPPEALDDMRRPESARPRRRSERRRCAMSEALHDVQAPMGPQASRAVRSVDRSC
jgi:cytochrome c oxidase cbb3-type subunit 3